MIIQIPLDACAIPAASGCKSETAPYIDGPTHGAMSMARSSLGAGRARFLGHAHVDELLAQVGEISWDESQ